MKNKNLQALAVILVAVVIAFAVAWAGGQNGAMVRGWPLLVFCAALSFGIQWVAFIPAYALKTERFYDLAGSLTYLALLASVRSKPLTCRLQASRCDKNC